MNIYNMNYIKLILSKDIGNIIFNYLTIDINRVKRNNLIRLNDMLISFENNEDKCNVNFPKYVIYLNNYLRSMELINHNKKFILNQISGLFN